MAERSIKRLIIARFLANLERCAPGPNPEEPLARKVERVTDLTQQAQATPMYQMAVGGETVISEDYQGYECEFQIAIKACVADHSKTNRYDQADAMVQGAQEVIEGDLQLIGNDQALCTMVEYSSEDPFTNEVNAPLGGSVLLYKIKYRRYRAVPTRRY